MKKISIFLTLFGFIFLFPSNIHAVSIQTHSYLITEAKEFMGTPLLPSVIYTKLLNVGYRSGKVVLSSTPDGTGSISLPDDVVVSMTTPSTESFRISPDCPANTKEPVDISHLLWKARNFPSANLTINLTYTKCKTYIKDGGVQKAYAKVGPLYIVHFDDYDPTATSPFLELPWNYKSKGLLFSDAALAMTSYFDHSFPLLSTTLGEPLEKTQQVLTFENTDSLTLPYSGHDGYDWAYKAGAKLEEPVLAAAAGTAQFINNCAACGNAITIDHGNGYQTRYYHLLSDGLITSDSTQKIAVSAGQPIGKIGYTGNVIPAGSTGAHLHFMLVHDKNHDGNFADNIPDGIVDPFGWQASTKDPWEQYTFTYKGENRTGDKSLYLWKNELAQTQNTVTSNGGTYAIDTAKIIVPKNMVNQDSILTISRIEPPPEDTMSTVRNIRITLKDGWGNIYTTFQTAFNILLSFNPTDIARYKPETLSIYSSSDGKTWNKEATTVNTTTGQASVAVKHLSEFALRGEKKDTLPPETAILLDGSNFATNVWISPVEISLDALDEPQADSLGIDYVLYKINEDSWQEYTSPILIEKEGNYTISYYGVDGDGNTEKIKTHSFMINYNILTPTTTPIPSVTPTTTVPTAVTLTPTFTPTPSLRLSSTPSIKPTPTIKTPRSKKRQPYYCKFLNEKTQTAMIKRLLRKNTKQLLQKLCN